MTSRFVGASGEVRSASVEVEPGKKKRNNLDSLLQDLKREENLSKVVSNDISHNVLCVTIPLWVNEQTLLMTFSEFGPIYSVKILISQHAHAIHNLGFVGFVHVEDAATALRRKNGTNIGGFIMNISYGTENKVNENSRIPLPRIIKPHGWHGKPWETSGIPARIYGVPACALTVPVVLPSPECKTLIDRLACLVSEHGYLFEKYLIDSMDPNYFFLFAIDTQEHLYYRWRVFSLSQGDTLESWRMEPFQMISGGAFWIPPSPEIKEKNSLSEQDCRLFENCLRNLTLEKENIKEAMAFAIDHSYAAAEIVAILVASLTLDQTPHSKKVARLYLLSDILHNSATPVQRTAAAFRPEIELFLKPIFTSFHKCFASSTSKIRAENLKERVIKVLRVWSAWSLYLPSTMDMCESIFLYGEHNPSVSEEVSKNDDDDIDGFVI